jgi:chemotaxis protein MotB
VRKRKRDDGHENLERWLITYADLITLLLAFFIMMYTFSKQDSQKYQEVANYLRAIFSGGAGIAGNGSLPESKAVEQILGKNSERDTQKHLEEEIQSVQSKEDSQRNIYVISSNGNIVVRVTDRSFFDEGRAELRAEAKHTLDRIAPILKTSNNFVRIEGHTDNIPISTAEFTSNWELSVRRATEVVRYLVEKHDFPPAKLSATGYAQYRPIVPNNSAKNRAINRRTDIIILSSEGRQLK